MNMREISEIAAKHGIKAGKQNKTKLVRTIQKAEGNDECFSTGKAPTCGQSSCLWREDCK